MLRKLYQPLLGQLGLDRFVVRVLAVKVTPKHANPHEEESDAVPFAHAMPEELDPAAYTVRQNA